MEGQRQKTWMVNFICILAILGVFAISALVLTNIGVRVYKNIVVDNSDNFKLRTSLSYVATKIRQADTQGKIYVTVKQDTSVLVLEEELQGESYETLIYYYDNHLYELFHRQGDIFEVSYGMQVMEIDKFTIEEISASLLEFTASIGSGDSEKLLIDIRTRR